MGYVLEAGIARLHVLCARHLSHSGSWSPAIQSFCTRCGCNGLADEAASVCMSMVRRKSTTACKSMVELIWTNGFPSAMKAHERSSLGHSGEPQSESSPMEAFTRQKCGWYEPHRFDPAPDTSLLRSLQIASCDVLGDRCHWPRACICLVCCPEET